MKKNGFIATSILYSFFLVFISLFVALILTYIHNQLLVDKINEKAENTLANINNTKLSDIKIGDYVSFNTDSNLYVKDLDPDANVSATLKAKPGYIPLNSSAKWIVSNKVDNNDGTVTLTFLGDLTAIKRSVITQYGSSRVPKVQNISIDVFNEMNGIVKNQYGGTENAFVKSIQYKNDTMKIDLINDAILSSLRNNTNIDVNIRDDFFNVGEAYVVKHTDTSQTNYTGSYYLYRIYNFSNYKNSSLDDVNKILNSYCNAQMISDGSVSYNANNTFGYLSISNSSDFDSDNRSLTQTKYARYCFYSSPVPYTHSSSEMIVGFDENETSGDLISNISLNSNILRPYMTVTVNKSDENSYLNSGKGSKENPYVMMDGVKAS